MGHYRGHTDFMTSLGQSVPVNGFFNAQYWIKFITAGVALWMQSLPEGTHTPCCDLNHIGGDGTGIGICLNQVAFLKPIWQPDNLQSKPPISWGRLDRCVIPSPSSSPQDVRSRTSTAKKFCKDLLSLDDTFRVNNRVNLQVHKESLPVEIYDALTDWLGNIENGSEKWLVLRRLLVACFTDESVLGVVTAQISSLLHDVLAAVNPQRPLAPSHEMKTAVWAKLEKIALHGMGDDIARLMSIELNESDKFCIRGKSYGLLLLLGELHQLRVRVCTIFWGGGGKRDTVLTLVPLRNRYVLSMFAQGAHVCVLCCVVNMSHVWVTLCSDEV
jgi:hypothetical protein